MVSTLKIILKVTFHNNMNEYRHVLVRSLDLVTMQCVKISIKITALRHRPLSLKGALRRFNYKV